MAKKKTIPPKIPAGAQTGDIEQLDETRQYEVLDVIQYNGERFVEGEFIYLDDDDAALLLNLKKPAIRATNTTREAEAVGSGTGTDANPNTGAPAGGDK